MCLWTYVYICIMIQLTKVEHCHSLIKPWDPGTRDKFCWSDFARDMTCIGPFTFKNSLLLSHCWRPQNHHLPASIVPDIYWRSNCLGQNVTHGLGIVTRVQFIKFYFTHSVQKYLQFQTSIYPLRNNELMLLWKNIVACVMISMYFLNWLQIPWQ